MRNARSKKRPAAFARSAVLALALAAAVGLGGVLTTVAATPTEPAWADNDEMTTGVPTDDTGVVETSPDQDQGKGDGAAAGADGSASSEGSSNSGDTAQGSPANGANTPLEPASPDAGDSASEGAEGEQDADGQDASDAASTPKKPRTVVPDAVFGDAARSNNLVNPQQKPDSSFIYDTSINDLQMADSYLNDQTVQVTGEVVGDRLWAEFDPGYCWIVLQSNDGSYAEVPVFMTEESTAQIDTYGAYGRKGTTLQVRGTFHLACPEHEGLTDLHADTISVVVKGSITERVLNPSSFIPGISLVVVGLIMLLVFHRMREGQR